MGLLGDLNCSRGTSMFFIGGFFVVAICVFANSIGNSAKTGSHCNRPCLHKNIIENITNL